MHVIFAAEKRSTINLYLNLFVCARSLCPVILPLKVDRFTLRYITYCSCVRRLLFDDPHQETLRYIIRRAVYRTKRLPLVTITSPCVILCQCM